MKRVGGALLGRWLQVCDHPKLFLLAKNRKKTEHINDSKQFSETQREVLFEVIENLVKEGEIFLGTGHASIEEIEEFNIVGATCLAMRRAMEEAALNSKNLWQPELKGKVTFQRKKGSR